MLTYAATLRDGYDDETNGALVRSTMSAYLPADKSRKNQIFDVVERSVSKVFFKHTFRVPSSKARLMGVVPSAFDYGVFAAFQAWIFLGETLGPRGVLGVGITLAGKADEASLTLGIEEDRAAFQLRRSAAGWEISPEE